MRLFLIFIVGFLTAARCKGSPRLLFANRKDIRVIDIEHIKASRKILVKDVDDASSVDFYYKKKIICWADINNEEIKCVSLSQGGGNTQDYKIVKLMKWGIFSPDGIAVDWVTEKIYWADSDTNKIEVAELFGNNRKVLYWDELDQPRAIALVPQEGLMFWSDWGETPKIERAGMNGDLVARRTIVNNDIEWPNGLTVDYVSKRLFWADGKFSHIASTDFNGGNRIKVHENLPHPFAVSFLHRNLFWTDWNTKAIHYCHLDNNTKCEIHQKLSMKLSPMYIHVYEESRQKNVDSMCNVNNGGCSNLCLIAPPPQNFSCACPTGITFKDNNKCKEAPDEMLLLARKSDVRLISLDTPEKAAVVLHFSKVLHAIAVDYDPVEKFVYWSDDKEYLIQKAKLDGTEQSTIVAGDGLLCDGLAVDWLARNIYWSNVGSQLIEVSRLNGTSRKILLRGNIDKPRSIALHPAGGLMFWTDWGTKAKIERANLDGSKRNLIVDSDLGWPNGVAIDFELQNLYWVDAKTHAIEFSDFDGKNRKVILQDNLPHAFGFSLLGDYVYWTDWQKRSVERIHKINGKNREVLVEQLPNVMGLRAVSLNVGLGSSKCQNNNGGCSHLCFTKPKNSYVCDCPPGYELDFDMRTCNSPNAFIIYSFQDEVHQISLNTSMESQLPIPIMKSAIAIAFESDEKMVYWIDSWNNTIFRSFLNGSKLQSVVNFDLAEPTDLVIDWVSKNLYFTDSSRGRIDVCKLNGDSRRTILWDIIKPTHIAIDPQQGFIFWVEEINASQNILRSHLDGSWSQILIGKDIQLVTDMLVDTTSSKLYWIDVIKKTIEYCDLDGANRKILKIVEMKLQNLAVLGDSIYWSYNNDKYIEQADKLTGKYKTKRKVSNVIKNLMIYEKKQPPTSPPCLEPSAACSHLCFNTPIFDHFRFKCACPSHHKLAEDKKTCIAPETFLLLSHKSSVTRMVINSSEIAGNILPIGHMKNIKSIAYEAKNDILMWTENRGKFIKKAPVNGSDAKIFIKGDKMRPHDIVIDSGTDVVFWSCEFTNNIIATRTDGTYIGKLLTKKNEDRPRKLSLHRKHGYLFFINSLKAPKIERLRLDGLYRQVIIDDLKNPQDVAIDLEEDRIYWIDDGIYSADLHGSNRKTLLTFEGNHIPTSFTILASYLYWFDANVNLLQRANKFDGADRKVISDDLNSVSDVIALTGSIFAEAVNHPCRDLMERCSHFCTIGTHYSQTALHHLGELSYSLKSVNLVQCSCPQGMSLSSDKNVCRMKPHCPQNHFTCMSGNQNCIHIRRRCDGLNECSDGSDEVDCPVIVCDKSLFRCTNGQCVERRFRCDRRAHCTDGSDELGCCPAGQALCKVTGHCLPCENIFQCPDVSADSCPFHQIHNDARSSSKAPYIVGMLASVVVLICISALVVYYRRRPSLLDDQELNSRCSTKGGQQHYRVVLSGGKVYTGVNGSNEPIMNGAIHTKTVVPGSHSLASEVVNVPLRRIGLLDRPATGPSSSSSSLTHYPRETINPPPTPVTESRPHHCYPSSYSGSISRGPVINSYRHYKSHNRPPPPTPCSTDVCDDSDFYSSTMYSPIHCRSRCCSSANQTEYDSDPCPPPCTPQTQCLDASSSPSPSTDRSYFIGGPCPSPMSPSHSD